MPAVIAAAPQDISHIIEKYDVQGPRYTSYPPASQFSSMLAPDSYQRYLEQRGPDAGPLSLYVHIPFCRDICYYCACNKVVTRSPLAADRYLNDLDAEIDVKSRMLSGDKQVSQLHLGGGTPTYFNAAQLTRLVHLLATHFTLIADSDREYSIEIDPRTVSEDDIALLAGLGFNRISVGVQDFDAEVQQAINRVQSFEMVAELTEAVRRYQFKSLNFDIIYGLPKQTEKSIEATLDRIAELRPDRIAVYNYAHLPERFSSQRQIARYQLPTAAQKLAIAQQIRQHLQNSGYVAIGMDHFAVAEDELAIAAKNGSLQRNFQGYSTTKAAETIGIGASSISSHHDRYVQNARTLEKYSGMLAAGQLPIEKICKLDSEDKLRAYVIAALSCKMAVSFEDVAHRFGVDFTQHFASEIEALTQQANDGLLKLDDHALELTELGRQLLRSVCMVFDQYQSNTQRGFSRIL